MYSSKKLLLDSSETLIAGDRVFVGNQCDEFAAAGVIQNGHRVLMLGLGYGGSLRTLLLGRDDVEITAVDLNPISLQACSSLMEDFFPNLNGKIRYVHGDASKFLEKASEKFDVICMDIYTNEGYPSFVFEPEFWQMITGSLAPLGTVLFNSWGLPQQLRPLEGATAQGRLAHTMKEHFKLVKVLPYRRNLTFIGTLQPTLTIQKRTSSFELNDIDRIIADVVPHRLRMAGTLDEWEWKRYDEGDLLTSMNELDSEMARRWPRLVSAVNGALTDCGYETIDSRDLRKLVCDPVRGRAVTERLLDLKAQESVFVPVAMGAYVFESSVDPNGLNWYLQWLVEEGEKLMKLHQDWFVSTALWQMLAMVANPYGRYQGWTEEIGQLVQRLELN